MEEAGPVVRSWQDEIGAILGGRAGDVGLEAASAPHWIDGFFRYVAQECGAAVDEPPRAFALRAKFRLHYVSLGAAGLAASTATDLWVPAHVAPEDMRLCLVHEFIHGMLARRGDDRGEADVWMATAAWVARSVRHPVGRGVSLYPHWFIRLIPAAFLAAD